VYGAKGSSSLKNACLSAMRMMTPWVPVLSEAFLADSAAALAESPAAL
jgi:hypothetical protein